MKGYFCGMSEGDGGFPTIRVDGRPVTFSMYADEPEVKFIGRKNPDLYKSVGREVIVAYVVKKKYRRPEKIVRSITFTGRVNKKTRPCDDE
ncbi:MAG: hypothetical protein JSS81_27425 [Acidobacteria bacterium]|nr:hypothetical protein [Acidobacteriota bacterium]